MKYCANCGAELDDTARFCGNCGASVSEVKSISIMKIFHHRRRLRLIMIILAMVLLIGTTGLIVFRSGVPKQNSFHAQFSDEIAPWLGFDKCNDTVQNDKGICVERTLGENSQAKAELVFFKDDTYQDVTHSFLVNSNVTASVVKYPYEVLDSLVDASIIEDIYSARNENEKKMDMQEWLSLHQDYCMFCFELQHMVYSATQINQIFQSEGSYSVFSWVEDPAILDVNTGVVYETNTLSPEYNTVMTIDLFTTKKEVTEAYALSGFQYSWIRDNEESDPSDLWMKSYIYVFVPADYDGITFVWPSVKELGENNEYVSKANAQGTPRWNICSYEEFVESKNRYELYYFM